MLCNCQEFNPSLKKKKKKKVPVLDEPEIIDDMVTSSNFLLNLDPKP